MSVNWLGLCRGILVYAHLSAMVAAAISIAFLDYAVFKPEGPSNRVVDSAARTVLLALVALWISGVAMIAIDTSFDLKYVSASPKLLAKICVVVALSVNGVLVHTYVLPKLKMKPKNTGTFTFIAAILGAISMASWGYAAFLGIAKNFTPYLGFSGFIALYLSILAVAIVVALQFVRPRLLERLSERSLIAGESMSVFSAR